MENVKCVFCGKSLTIEECNNPEPIMGAEFDCCADCNDKFVIPARKKQLKDNTTTPNGKTIMLHHGKYILFDAVSKKYQRNKKEQL